MTPTALFLGLALAAAAAPAGMVTVPAGVVQPFFRDLPAPQSSPTSAAPARSVATAIDVVAFFIDEKPVTNAAFVAFLRSHSEWSHSHVKHLFADVGYLRAWVADLDPGPRNPANSPIIDVSWFAAKAFCKVQGKTLPTVAQWERAASESGDATSRAAKESTERILAWYGAPSPDVLPSVGGSAPNRFGIFDLHALVWEWTLDFNNAMTGDDGRAGDSPFFCGSGGARAVDASDYATFMRYAFRSSLKASYAVRNLGFRCAQEIHR